MKSIYGYDVPYAKMRKRARITTRREIRIELVDKFAKKALSNPIFIKFLAIITINLASYLLCGSDFHS